MGTAPGFLTILLAGLLQGTVLTPMAYLKKWSWENIWLVYASFAYLLLPWVFGLSTIPHLVSVFASTAQGVMFRTLVFGFFWGLAVVLFGLGIDMLGLALGFAIILGLGTSVGALVPLIGQHRDQLWAPTGVGTLSGVLFLIVAVVLFSMAGKQRERKIAEFVGNKAPDEGRKPMGGFLAGLVVCIICGVLNPLYNIAFAYGAEIQRQAIRYGAQPANAGNGVWLLVANAGFLPSLMYSIFLLNKNKTWGTFREGTAKYWLLTPAMGLMWISGTVLYGVGANLMGSLGPVIGWPVLMSSMVLTANFWGFLTGEWRGVRGRPVYLQFAGLAILVAAMFLLGFVSKL